MKESRKISKKYILNFTPTGLIPTREMTSKVPLEPHEVADQVLEAPYMIDR